MGADCVTMPGRKVCIVDIFLIPSSTLIKLKIGNCSIIIGKNVINGHKIILFDGHFLGGTRLECENILKDVRELGFRINERNCHNHQRCLLNSAKNALQKVTLLALRCGSSQNCVIPCWCWSVAIWVEVQHSRTGANWSSWWESKAELLIWQISNETDTDVIFRREQQWSNPLVGLP